jgi:methylmalonyl-CoA/ethylmalonyl-CoA epimerase
LKAWLAQHGPGLHHLCMAVDDVGEAHEALPNLGLGVAPSPHQGTQGKRALFLKPDSTMGVVLEVTGP